MKTDILVLIIYLVIFTVTMMSGDLIIRFVLKKFYKLDDRDIFEEEEL